MQLDFDVIATRLRQQVTSLKLVGTATDLEQAKFTAMNPPQAWVLPYSEKASANLNMQGALQPLLVQFSVILAARSAKDGTGAASYAELRTIRLAIFTALTQSWVPISGGHQIEYVQGEFLDYKNSVLYWRELYKVQTYLG